ncbi:MAG: type II toxin-antitoxin system prevent-host-death family antitoxin [Terracidiphilus sp.]|jgi:prevent-host-death family protein
MQTIQASEAKTKFLSILDDVERGASIIVTRHGKPIARIVPEEGIITANEIARREKVREAIHDIEQLRKRVGKMSLAEIVDAKNEGRM